MTWALKDEWDVFRKQQERHFREREDLRQRPGDREVHSLIFNSLLRAIHLFFLVVPLLWAVMLIDLSTASIMELPDHSRLLLWEDFFLFR